MVSFNNFCIDRKNHKDFSNISPINIIDKINELAEQSTLKYCNQSLKLTFTKKKLANQIVTKFIRQIYKGNIKFNYDNTAETNCIIYDKIYSEFKFSHCIRDDTFKNSMKYQIKIYLTKKCIDSRMLENILDIVFLPGAYNFVLKVNYTRVIIVFKYI